MGFEFFFPGTPTEQTILHDAMNDGEDEDEEEETTSSVKPPMIETDDSEMAQSLAKSLNSTSIPSNVGSSLQRENAILSQDSNSNNQDSNQYSVVAQEQNNDNNNLAFDIGRESTLTQNSLPSNLSWNWKPFLRNFLNWEIREMIFKS